MYYVFSGRPSLKGLCKVLKELKETKSCAVILGRRVLGRGNGTYKTPEARGVKCRSYRAMQATERVLNFTLLKKGSQKKKEVIGF